MSDLHVSDKVAKRSRMFKCLSCGHLGLYSKIQISKLRHVPHCVICGGTTEETEASYKRHLGIKREVTTLSAGQHKCKFCKKPFRTMIALKLHYEEIHGVKS